MALQKARQLDLARARFGSLMAPGPQIKRPQPSHLSYLHSLMQPAWSSNPVKSRVRETRSSLIQTRVASIRQRSTPTHPVFFKCGDRRHKAMQCRNALICFICNRTGHKSDACHSVTSIPINTELEASSESLMAPPGNRRGAQRGRIPLGPRSRPPMRPPGTYPSPPPTIPIQWVSERPPQHPNGNVAFAGSVVQTPPDRPVQQRAPPPPPPPTPVPDSGPAQALPPRQIYVAR